MGHREGRHPLHALVPAPDRHHVGEARQFPRPVQRRPSHHELLRKRADPGRARCLQLPVRGAPRHLRGPRLHRLGSHLLRLHQRRGAVHPDGILLLHRRGSRQEDAAFALDERGGGAGQPRAGPVRRAASAHRAHAGRRAGILPRVREGLCQAPGSHHDGPHPVRLRPLQGPGARRALLRRHPPHRQRVHEGTGQRAVGARRAGSHEAQRGGSGAARAGSHLHEREPRRG